VVEPGQTLMRIAPSGSSVEIEAKLANQDVGFVRPGMPVVVKVEMLPVHALRRAERRGARRLGRRHQRQIAGRLGGVELPDARAPCAWIATPW
jgi:HlyD family secretion protein